MFFSYRSILIVALVAIVGSMAAPIETASRESG